MSSIVRFATVVAIFFASGLVAGCGGKQEQKTAEPKKKTVKKTAAKSPASKSPDGANDSGDKTKDIADADDGEFQPPFPNRVNPFKRPDFNQLIKSNSASQEDIKLRGFINVNGIRALLAINGQIQPVREGDKHHGVQVIKIIPPNVILQKGRVRWTQKLFDGGNRDSGGPGQRPLRAGRPRRNRTPF